MNNSILPHVAKGVAIVVLLLILRWIIGAIGKGVAEMQDQEALYKKR